MFDEDSNLVMKLARRERDAYMSIDLNRLAVYTLAQLREIGVAPSFENVTAALFQMFPERFALAGYPYPDSNRVNRALLQLGPKYRNWARGSTRTGYALTQVGENVLESTRKLLEGQSGRPANTAPEQRYTWDIRTDVDELRATSAFGRFIEDGIDGLTDDDVWNVLQAFPYTPQKAVRQRLVQLKRYAANVHDNEVGRFIDALRVRFEAIVRT